MKNELKLIHDIRRWIFGHATEDKMVNADDLLAKLQELKPQPIEETPSPAEKPVEERETLTLNPNDFIVFNGGLQIKNTTTDMIISVELPSRYNIKPMEFINAEAEKPVEECVFCKKLKGMKIRTAFFEPLNPVVKGHMLGVPVKHLTDFAHSPIDTANVMRDVSAYIKRAGGEWNIITSIGKNATQTVFHFHVHLIPRQENDGLKLPWTEQKSTEPQQNKADWVEGFMAICRDTQNRGWLAGAPISKLKDFFTQTILSERKEAYEEGKEKVTTTYLLDKDSELWKEEMRSEVFNAKAETRKEYREHLLKWAEEKKKTKIGDVNDALGRGLAQAYNMCLDDLITLLESKKG